MILHSRQNRVERDPLGESFDLRKESGPRLTKAKRRALETTKRLAPSIPTVAGLQELLGLEGIFPLFLGNSQPF